MGGKTRNIAIQLVLQQCYKTSCTFFVARFSVPLGPYWVIFKDVYLDPNQLFRLLSSYCTQKHKFHPLRELRYSASSSTILDCGQCYRVQHGSSSANRWKRSNFRDEPLVKEKCLCTGKSYERMREQAVKLRGACYSRVTSHDSPKW